MDLTAILWIFVSAAALVFAGDAMIERVIRMQRAPVFARRSTVRFAVLMFLFAIACSGVAVYEVLT